ncbi:DUF2812 domain-containing protein [Paenibacillus methanolicus]|uniref:Uncharacterized protein DUF2812 n=1 Tax=Paenibacillus methanolicus TaxID=582686 RepID=A0A5S5CIR9_9BACL|nr:DUF2812 domain-containing protein [Paenibacillus methanolicus]TYP79424.1 uncharacterized protein DUF2812 [Paenibacillus methanolicus]
MVTDIGSAKSIYKNRLSFVWDYKRDEAWLADCSKRGLQLNRPGVFRYRFDFDQSVRYEYRMDYQDTMNDKQLEEYCNLYADAGWEYVGTCVNWRYFRRQYLEGETTELYSDKESIRSFYRRVQKMLGIIALVNFVVLLVNSKHWISGLMGESRISILIGALSVFQLLCVLLLGYGVLKFQKLIKLHSD